jgi:uncharacterized protein YkwD
MEEATPGGLGPASFGGETTAPVSDTGIATSAEAPGPETTGRERPMPSAFQSMSGSPVSTSVRPMGSGRPGPLLGSGAVPSSPAPSGSGVMAVPNMSGSAGPLMTGAAPQPSSTVSIATGSEVPATEHCAAVANWDPAWTQWEDEVLELVNSYRANGYNCDAEGEFAAAPALKMDPILRCSARLHSLDMFERGYFAHESPDGIDPTARMAAAGFKAMMSGENIAMGQTSPAMVMKSWMDSDGHCSNIMQPKFELIGIGYHPGSASDFKKQRYWTQNFGTPSKKGSTTKP